MSTPIPVPPPPQFCRKLKLRERQGLSRSPSILVVEQRLELQLHGSRPSALFSPLLALDGSPELERGFREGKVSLPRVMSGHSLEKFKAVDSVSVHTISLEPWGPKLVRGPREQSPAWATSAPGLPALTVLPLPVCLSSGHIHSLSPLR